MSAELSISRETGSIRIGDLAVLEANQTKDSVEPKVADLLVGSRNHGNGYEWLDLLGLTFGGQPACLSLCFHGGRLERASWSVQLSDAATEGGWPTREAIDAELSFVQSTLAREMGIHTRWMPWGEVSSSFDEKGFMAANGLSYRRS